MPDRYLPGVPCRIELLAPEPEAAEAFHAALFGWDVADGVARLGGRSVAGIRQGDGAPWTTATSVASRAPAGAGRWRR